MMQNISENKDCKKIYTFIQATKEDVLQWCKDLKNKTIDLKVNCWRIAGSEKPCKYKRNKAHK